MVKRVDCPICKKVGTVRVVRDTRGNVIGFVCAKCTTFGAHCSYDADADQVIYTGSPQNQPDNQYEMFREQPMSD